MKLFNSKAMRELDRYAIEECAIASVSLMESAAAHVADAAAEVMGSGGHCAIFCGSGNNGGDGVAAAAILRRRGFSVRAFLVGRREKMTYDTRTMEARLIEAGGELEEFGADYLREYVQTCDVIVDAIFGIGLNSPLRGAGLEAVELINSARATVISADVPSGVEADTGRILGDAVRADITVTFSMGKPGLYTTPGCIYAGEVRVRDIGIPAELLEARGSSVYTVTGEDIMLPRRAADSHKGDYGRCLIVAGAHGYTGAPVLAAQAASRSGAGLVFLGVPRDIYSIAAVKCGVEMAFPLAETAGNYDADEIIKRSGRPDAILIGPGLGRSVNAEKLVYELIHRADAPVVLDADGINAVAGNIDILSTAVCPLILTPHEGEFARLGGDVTDGGRLKAASEFAKMKQCVLILKGHRTITALPDGSCYINTSGGPGLAKGGSGDVLAGMLVSLLGQGFPIKDACIAAVYLHGLAGDICTERYGEYSVTADDIIAALPEAIKRHIN